MPWQAFQDVSAVPMQRIPLDKVTAAIRQQAHIRYKMGSDATTRTYNLTVNRRRQILHSIAGHPGRWNNKAVIRFDSFMADLRDGAFDDTMEFKLKRKKMVNTALNLVDCDYEKQDDIEDVTIKGAYVIVDN
jgi:hypothetical protein